MTTPPILPLEDLLRPIPGDAPCGESLRWDDVWTEIKNARSSTVDAVDASADASADWQNVIDLTSEALRERSKDLMLAAWLTEAAIKVHGFAGLRDGLCLIRQLLENFWEDVHPKDEDGDLEVRVAPLVWISDGEGGARLPNLLRMVSVIGIGTDASEACTYMQWNSRFVAPQGPNEDADDYSKRRDLAEKNKEQFESSVAAVSREICINTQEILQEAKEEVQHLNTLLDTKLGVEVAPSWRSVINAIDEINTLLTRIINDKGGLPAVDSEAESIAPSGDASANATTAHSGPIQTRADAIRHLAEAADFLRRTEPHSPVAYLVDRAVRWANKPFKDVLADLIKDNGVLSQVGEVLGLEEESEE